ncbi:MAG: nitrilase-related carbon-nitrogen hydrolase [Hyphomicrobiales bacterium]
MRIGFLQFEVKQSSIRENLETVYQHLHQERFDLVVLPELFTSGYLFDSYRELALVSEVIDVSNTVKFLQDLASKTGGTILGTIPEKDGGKIYNTAIVVNSSGLVGIQRKFHLTPYEQELFLPGDSMYTFNIADAVVGVATCFDVWFPEYSRLLTENGADIICHPSAFGGTDTIDMIRIRALENRVFSILSNQTGIQISNKMKAKFRGESRIYNPSGQLLHTAEKGDALHFEEIDIKQARDKKSILSNDFAQEWRRYNISLNQ